MKRPFLLLVLSLFNSASAELRQPLVVDVCRSRTSDDVSFRLCVTKCGEMSPTNHNSAFGADVNTVKDLLRQFRSDGDIETEGGSTYEALGCFPDPEGSRISPPGSGDTEGKNRVRSLREDDDKDGESKSFVDFEKSSDFGDLKKRLTSFFRSSQQNLPDKPFARHHISAEEGELIHADNQERNLFPVSPSPKIAENRGGSFIQIARQGPVISNQIESVTEDVDSKENSNTLWNSVDHHTDENSELAKSSLGTADTDSGENDQFANSLEHRPFGEEERAENSLTGVGESAFGDSKRQTFARFGQSQLDPEEMGDSSLMRAGGFSHEEKRPSFVRVGKSLHEEKRPSFVRVGKSFNEEKRPSFVRVGKSLRVEKRPSFVRVGKSFREEKRPSFVRVGKSLIEEKRPSFVRVGKSFHEEKRPSFVRVGKSFREEKRPSFVRVGKSFREEKRPSFVRVGKSFREEKRPSFVRVGKSFHDEKRPSFVRVGKSLHEEKRPSFVRVGKSELRDIGDEDNAGLMSSLVEGERNCERNRAKRQSFVRIGKSRRQAEAQPQSNSLPLSHSNNMRDNLELAGRQQIQTTTEAAATTTTTTTRSLSNPIEWIPAVL